MVVPATVTQGVAATAATGITQAAVAAGKGTKALKAATHACGANSWPRSGQGIAPQPGSQDSSPSKPLPPKTPTPTQLDAGTPLPSAQLPLSALTHALQQDTSLPVGAAASLQQTWGGAAPAAAAVQSGSEDEDGDDDGMLLFNAPAVGSGGLDPQLLVHSPKSSLDASDVLLEAAAAAAGGGSLVGSPTCSNQDAQALPLPPPQQQQQEGEDGDGGGERTPQPPSVLQDMPGTTALVFPAVEPGFSLADMLQGPAPPAHRVPDVGRSPSSRPAFLQDLPHLPNLDDALAGLSPRHSLQLPGCSPLGLTGLRDPPHLLGMPLPPLVPRPPLVPLGLSAGHLGAAPPQRRGPLAGPPRTLAGHLPSGLPPPHASALRLPLLMGQGMHTAGVPPPLGPLKGPGPLMRPAGPLPPHHHLGMPGMGMGTGLRPPLGALPRPAGGPLMLVSAPRMVPVPVPAGGCETGAEWAPLEDESLTAEGVHAVLAAVPPEPTQQQQQRATSAPAAGPDAHGPPQQQAQQPSDTSSGDKAAGATVAVQAAGAIRAPAATAAYAAIKAEAAAGAAAAAAAILAAPAIAIGAAAAAGAGALPYPAGQAPLRRQPMQLAPGSGALRRMPAGDLMQSRAFRSFLAMLHGNSTEFEAQGRVLRLRQFLRADVRPRVLDAVLDALEANTRVEALYIQNFEQGLLDEQLDRLVCLLRHRRIWALNVGENFNTTQPAWRRFCEALPGTAVAHLFVSEQHLVGSDLKARMCDAIRINRRAAPPRDPEVIVHVGAMWCNPKLPPAAGTYSPCGASAAAVRAAATAGAAAVVTVPLPAGASRESLSCGDCSGGSAPADVGSAGRAGSAPSSAGAATSGDASAAHAAAAPAPGSTAVTLPTGVPGSTEVAVHQGYALRVAPKRRQGYDEVDYFTGSPLAKRGPGVSAFAEAATAASAAAAAAAAPEVAAATMPMNTSSSRAVGVAAGYAGSRRRASCPSAARLLHLQSGFSSEDVDEELDESYAEEDEDDAAYLPFKSGMLVSGDPCAAPTRASRRIQCRGSQPQGRLPLDDDFITFDPDEEPPSPRHTAATATRRLRQSAATVAAAQQRTAAARARSAAAAAANTQPAHGLPSGVVPVGGSGASLPLSSAGTLIRAAPCGGAGTARGSTPHAAAAAAKRSVQSAAQRMRSSSGRQSSGDLKGRPSFAELLESGFMQPGAYRFTVGMQDIHAALEADGTILYAGARYRAISKFALVVLRERNPSRQSCDGWKEVTWNGEKLDVLRARFQSHQRKAAARKAGAAAAAAAAAATLPAAV